MVYTQNFFAKIWDAELIEFILTMVCVCVYVCGGEVYIFIQEYVSELECKLLEQDKVFQSI